MKRWEGGGCAICDNERSSQLCDLCFRSLQRWQKKDDSYEGAIVWGARRARWADQRRLAERMHAVGQS